MNTATKFMNLALVGHEEGTSTLDLNEAETTFEKETEFGLRTEDKDTGKIKMYYKFTDKSILSLDNTGYTAFTPDHEKYAAVLLLMMLVAGKSGTKSWVNPEIIAMRGGK